MPVVFTSLTDCNNKLFAKGHCDTDSDISFIKESVCNNKLFVKGYRDTDSDISFIKESVLSAVYLQNLGKSSN